MPKVTPITPTEFERFLKAVGCRYIRQKGSHRVYHRVGLLRPIIIPIHGGDLPAFVVRNTLKQLGMSIETYLQVLADC
jgi:predicted RNA binding protein YcfA (HicA-like mRNA interferase family)